MSPNFPFTHFRETLETEILINFFVFGTIKKRPSIIGTHPKLPLTNTTRGLVRDSEDDSSSIGKFEKTFLGDSWRIPRGSRIP